MVLLRDKEIDENEKRIIVLQHTLNGILKHNKVQEEVDVDKDATVEKINEMFLDWKANIVDQVRKWTGGETMLNDKGKERVFIEKTLSPK